MNKIFRNGLMMLATGALAVSCADYNETSGFTAEPDPTYVEPYNDLDPVKSYINKEKYPNMSLGATLKVADFNKQELAHAAAITNFNNVTFGSTLMSGAIISEKGIMNFLSMIDLLNHVQEIGGEVYGSAIAANANQADKWLEYLTSPIEIPVDPIDDADIDYTKMEEWHGTQISGKNAAKIVKNYDGSDNALMVPKSSQVYIAEGFDVDLQGKYTVTFYTKVEKDATINCTFSDSTMMENAKDKKKYQLKAGNWQKIVLESLSPKEDATTGYFMIGGNKNADVYIKAVKIFHEPDNHRPQTDQERNDTIHYALNTWCETLMKYNEGRIKSFDLIEEAIDTKSTLGNGMYDLKHAGKDQIFWQDILGSENYAPVVSDIASAAFTKYGGNPADLKFFISESGLEEAKKFESLEYWIGVWENKGAQIDGINAKLNIFYSEDAATQEATETTLNTLLDNLAKTGKLIRLSNFDFKYQDAEGSYVTADKITAEQRQKLADFYGHALKLYMSKIPNEKQAGICKTNMVDTSNGSGDPVGLWTISSTKDWVRTATYKAFCDALSGK